MDENGAREQKGSTDRVLSCRCRKDEGRFFGKVSLRNQSTGCPINHPGVVMVRA